MTIGWTRDSIKNGTLKVKEILYLRHAIVLFLIQLHINITTTYVKQVINVKSVYFDIILINSSSIQAHFIAHFVNSKFICKNDTYRTNGVVSFLKCFCRRPRYSFNFHSVLAKIVFGTVWVYAYASDFCQYIIIIKLAWLLCELRKLFESTVVPFTLDQCAPARARASKWESSDREWQQWCDFSFRVLLLIFTNIFLFGRYFSSIVWDFSSECWYSVKRLVEFCLTASMS